MKKLIILTTMLLTGCATNNFTLNAIKIVSGVTTVAVICTVPYYMAGQQVGIVTNNLMTKMLVESEINGY